MLGVFLRVVTIQDTALGQLNDLVAEARQPRKVIAAAARATATLFRRHLIRLNKSRSNKLGGARTNFFFEMSRFVNVAEVTDRNATVDIAHPLATHKHFGGPIKPRRYPFLSIPVHASAHGLRPSVLAKREERTMIYCWNRETGRGVAGFAGENGIEVRYALTNKTIVQGPDPAEGILPTDSQIAAVALPAAEKALFRQT